MAALSQFALKLYKIRTEYLYTQEQMAEMLNISTRWYQKLECGNASPNFELTCRIVKIFNINLAEFCEEEEIGYGYFKT